MESCSFQSQLLSVMEVLAKAAVAEINRCVDESCAVLRLEVSQSRRDIDLLKSKCEVLEAELRRSRMRARRKVFNPSAAAAAARFPPLVKVVLNKESQGSHWDTPVEPQAPDKPQQSAEDMETANGADHMQIKEEAAEEDMWKNDGENRLISGPDHQPCFGATKPTQTDSFVEHYHSAENPTHSETLVSQADCYRAFPEQQQQLNSNQNETDLLVKHEKEEETDENAAPLTSAHTFVTETVEGQLWSSSMCGETGDPSVSYTEQQFEEIPAAFASPTRLHLEDVAPRIHSVGKLNSPTSVARTKRRARTFGCKRPQSEDGHSTVCQTDSKGPSFISQQLQHQNRDATPHTRNPEDLAAPNPAAPFGTHRVSSSSSLARRMRTPWRSGLGEKRFSCTYCDKSFSRFSQLKEHLRSHTGEKPFSCMQCGRSFTKQCNLIRHAVVHSGEKPYECSLCGKCFTQRSSLKSHQKTAHL